MILAYAILLVACLGLAVSSLAASARGWHPSVQPSGSELRFGWAALLVALAVSGWLMFGPVVASRSTTIAANGMSESVDKTTGLLETGDMAAFTVLALVVALTAMPIIWARRRFRYWAEMWGALILAALSLLAGFSIGIFLLPVAILLFVAAMLGRASERTA